MASLHGAQQSAFSKGRVHVRIQDGNRLAGSSCNSGATVDVEAFIMFKHTAGLQVVCLETKLQQLFATSASGCFDKMATW